MRPTPSSLHIGMLVSDFVLLLLVVPSKLSWGRTSRVFVPRKGLIMGNPGPKQLWPLGAVFSEASHWP